MKEVVFDVIWCVCVIFVLVNAWWDAWRYKTLEKRYRELAESLLCALREIPHDIMYSHAKRRHHEAIPLPGGGVAVCVAEAVGSHEPSEGGSEHASPARRPRRRRRGRKNADSSSEGI